MRVEITEPIMTAIPPPNTVANSLLGMLSMSALTVEIKFDADAMLEISNGIPKSIGSMWMFEGIRDCVTMCILVLMLLLLGAKADVGDKRDAIIKIVDVDIDVDDGNDFIF
jgi:hypothetical protein